MSDEEKRSIGCSSEESAKCSSKRSNNNENCENLPKRPRMSLWENQNKTQLTTNKDDNGGVRVYTDDSDTDKSSEYESDDETSLEELAASICGLPHSELYPDELDMFPWLQSQSEVFRSVYLYIRNRACMVWLKDPKIQLTDKTLIQSINSSSCDKYFQEVIGAKLCSHQKNEDSQTAKAQSKSNNNNNTTNNNNNGDNGGKCALKKFDIDLILKDNVYKDNIAKLATVAIAFLERYGFVNIGCFSKHNEAITNGSVCGSNGSPLQVIIIGAGLTGIMAALQLQYFGCKVLVLEAKETPGGRMLTFQQDSWQVDISPYSITGINNPVNQLIKQAGLSVTFFNNEADIVDPSGDPVSKEAISRIECELNRLLLAAHDICSKFSLDRSNNNNIGVDSTNKKRQQQQQQQPQQQQVSLGEMLDALLSLQTLHCSNLKKSSNLLILKLMNRLQEVIVEMEKQKDAVAKAHGLWCQAEEEAKAMKENKKDSDIKEEPKEGCNETMSSLSPINIDLLRTADDNDDDNSKSNIESGRQKPAVPVTVTIDPSSQMKVNLSLSEYRRQFKECLPFFEEAIKLRKMIKLIQDCDPSSLSLLLQHSSNSNNGLLDWFLGNIELRSGTKLTNLSLTQSSSSSSLVDYFSSGRDEIYINKGFKTLINILTKKNSAFQYNSIVKEINYQSDGVQITAINSALSEDEPVLYTGDVIISTLPLGVLKESINNPSGTNSPQFDPPLPDWKKNSINNLGFGIVHKVVMCFKERFWGSSKTKLFAQLKSNSELRGEFLQFYAFAHRRRRRGAVATSEEGESSDSLSTDDCDDDDDNEDDDNGDGRKEERGRVGCTIVAVICGQAALTEDDHDNNNSNSSNSDEEVCQRALAALRAVFLRRKVTVPEPLSLTVCRWSRDVYSRGVFSFIPEGASASSDVSNISAPLPHDNNNNSSSSSSCQQQQPQRYNSRSSGSCHSPPRLYFAGEHCGGSGGTVGTIEAAMTSGLRVAAEVAKAFFPQLPNSLSRLPNSLQLRK